MFFIRINLTSINYCENRFCQNYFLFMTAVKRIANRGFKPAFTYLDGSDLFFTAFGLTGRDAVYRIKNFAGDCQNAKPEMLFDHFDWPNAVEPIPDSVFGANWFSLATGFFPPNKNDGCIALFNGEDHTESLSYLSPGCWTDDVEHDHYFYHKVQWVDMGRFVRKLAFDYPYNNLLCRKYLTMSISY